MRRLDWVSLALIFSLAAWVRLGWVGVSQWSFDHARVSLLALQMARGGQFAWLGMTASNGLPNFPAAVWIYALPFALSPDPLLATLFTGALGALAVVGVWWLAHHAWGAGAAFVAALLLAVSPYLTLYSRDIWSQDLLPPLTVAWAICAVLGIERRRGLALALHIFLAGFAFQVHYAGIALIVPTLWLLIRYRLWARWQAVLLGGLAALLCAAPAVYTLACCAPDALTVLAASTARAGVQWQTFQHALALIVGLGWESQFVALGRAEAVGSGAMLGGLLALGVVAALRRNPATVFGALWPAWALTAPVLFATLRAEALIHYQLITAPVGFVLIGQSVNFIERKGWRGIVLVFVSGIAVFQLWGLANALTTIGASALGAAGTPLRYPRAAVAVLRDGQPIIVHAASDQPEFDADAGGFAVLLWDTPHALVNGRNALLVPPPGGHLLMPTDTIPAWGEWAANGLTGTVQAFPRRINDQPYWALTVGAFERNAFQPVTPVMFANGAELHGWRARMVAGHWRMSTLWHITQAGTPRRVQQFNHFYTAQQTNPLAIQDISAAAPAWRAGDWLITWVDFAPPHTAGPYFLDVGLYTLDDLQRLPTLNRPGDSLAPIRLGPIEVR
jgi:hypothetical protein